MLSTIQRKAAGYFCQDTNVPMTSKKLSECFDLDYNETLDMMTLDHDIVSFVRIDDSYVTAVEGITISQDSFES